MSEFLTPLDVRFIRDELARLLGPLRYRSDYLAKLIHDHVQATGRPPAWVTALGPRGMSGHVDVPAGYETDFASVPRWPVVYWLAGGRATSEAVVHDYLCNPGRPGVRVPWAVGAAVFREAMGVMQQRWWRRGGMWLFVRLYGFVRRGSK